VTIIRRYCSTPCRDRAHCRRRRALRKKVRVERYAAAEVFARDGWVCQLCNAQVDRSTVWPDGMSLSIDHVVPISLGGDDVISNVQTAHLACNIRKGNRVAI
jgi:5-methylcytosine-specific restriction endonuclease McrA